MLPLAAQSQDAPVFPPLEYRSVLGDYAPNRETTMVDWRTANDTVGRLGGHMGHVVPQGAEPERGSGTEPSGAAPAGKGGGQP